MNIVFVSRLKASTIRRRYEYRKMRQRFDLSTPFALSQLLIAAGGVFWSANISLEMMLIKTLEGESRVSKNHVRRSLGRLTSCRYP